jgi:hypothetical protein
VTASLQTSDTPLPAELGAMDLIKETLATTAQLAEKQVELLRAEMAQTIVEERKKLIVVSVGIAASLAGISVLLMSAALAAGFALGHAALFTLGMGLLVCAAGAVMVVVGIRGLEQAPLSSSRQIVKEEIEWAKQKLSETTSASSPETSSDSVVAANR